MLSDKCMIPIIDKNSIEQCKRASFLFGKIIPFYRTVVPMAKRSRFPVSRWLIREEDSLNWMKSELEWMYEQGILVALKKDPDQNDSHFDDFDDEKPCWICHIPHESGTGQTRFFWQMQNDDIDRFDNLNTISKTFVEHPIFYETSSYMHKSPESSNDKRNSVIEVVLNQFPYPTADTPWEQIIDWRSDNDAQIKFRRLKHFVNTVSQRNDLNLKHLEDEILTLIDDYEQHMKIHKIKNNVGVFHGFVTTIPEILEDMIKLKFKDLSEIPFKLYERKVLKLEADMNAPGRELAYIVETKRNFGGS